MQLLDLFRRLRRQPGRVPRNPETVAAFSLRDILAPFWPKTASSLRRKCRLNTKFGLSYYR